MCGGGGGIISSIGKAISGAVSGIGKAISSVAKNPIFQAVAPVALNFFAPGLGVAMTGALGLSASWAPALMGAVTGGAMGALGGGGISGALRGAALGGITSGVADYIATGNNPLSGMFGSSVDPTGAGGRLVDPLTAGGSGSTQLTGQGSGLGLDKSTLGTQFGQVSPSSSSSSFGSLNPSAGAGGVGIKVPTSAVSLGGSSSSGGLSGLWDSAKSLASKLIPDSTIGKVALGGLALNMLGGSGQKQQQAQPVDTAKTDPQFTTRLPQYNYDPHAQDFSGRNLLTYGQGKNAYNPYQAYSYNKDSNKWAFDPTKGMTQDNAVGEQQFFKPTYSNQAGTVIDPRTGLPVQQAKRGGLMQYADGGLAHYAYGGYAEGGMPDVESDHGYLRGMGDGVSDDIEATIGGDQPARLSGGEFVIPARIVSEIGNGSSDAGASRLQEMMQRINEKRLATKDFAKDTKAYQELPA